MGIRGPLICALILDLHLHFHRRPRIHHALPGHPDYRLLLPPARRGARQRAEERRRHHRLQPPELYGRAHSHGRHPPPGALHHVLQNFPDSAIALHLQKRGRVSHRRTTRRRRAVPRLL